jgi:hypothetical protein
MNQTCEECTLSCKLILLIDEPRILDSKMVDCPNRKIAKTREYDALPAMLAGEEAHE